MPCPRCAKSRGSVVVAPGGPEPEYEGVVDTPGGGGGSVVWVSGDKFVPGVAGRMITIAGAEYGIYGYASPNQIGVSPAPPVQVNVPYAIYPG
jgi:hypothetical protein